MVDAYIAAMFFTTEFEGDKDDLAEFVLSQMIRDCVGFCVRNADILRDLSLDGYRDSQLGHDLWLSRNGHGAGFFDHHPKDERWDKLQASARGMGNVEDYFYQSPKDGLVSCDFVGWDGSIPS